MSALRRLLTCCVLLAACVQAQAAGARAALVTVLDGDARLLRDDGEFQVVEGLALQPGDILVTGPQARLLRIETADGAAVALGPQTQALVEPRLAGDGIDGVIYLLAGWAKVNAPTGHAVALAGAPLALWSAGAAVATWPTPAGGAMVFAETGASQLHSRALGGAPASLAAGQMLTLAPAAKPELATRPTPAFVQTMPRAFMDSLPSRAAAFAGKDVAPKRLGALTWADAQPWIDAEPALRRAFAKRWHGLAREADFRRNLVAGLKQHPEWEPVLDPPAAASRAAAAKH